MKNRQKSKMKVLGLMSGTSLDGVDAAVIDTDGEQVFGFGASHFRPYTASERAILAQATQDAITWNFSGPPPNSFARAEAVIHQSHIDAAAIVLAKNADIDLIGMHGQTLLHHAPTGGAIGQSLQIGDGAVLARALGIDTVFDFRSNDIASGGQGAPLAPVYHAALAAKSDLRLPAAILNIGGVSNLTVVLQDGTLLATDCGPGNGPLDSWVKANVLGEYDKDGALSLAGTPDIDLLERWMRRPFFTAAVPKSADRWDFDVLSDLKTKTAEDGAASLAAFCASGIGKCLSDINLDLSSLIICGGGRKNPAILAALTEHVAAELLLAEDLGWRGDDIEAQAFAFLAARSVYGLPLSYPGTTGIKAPVSGGRLAAAKDLS